MDYTKMLQHHEKMGADCTIAVIEVPMEEASRFGIMNTKPDTQIFEFEDMLASQRLSMVPTSFQ